MHVRTEPEASRAPSLPRDARPSSQIKDAADVQIGKINAQIADKRSEMESLKGQIEQLEGSVLEREMIHEIQSQNSDASKDGYKKFEEMHMKRKLQTLVGMQTQEIELLREELDRLRRRTFPTFTHYEQARAL